MTTGKLPKFYLDSCILLCWLNRETDIEKQKYGQHIPYIEALLQENFEGKNQIIGCQVINVEALPSTLTEEKIKSLKRLYSSGANQMFDVDAPIADKAREIRDYYKVNPMPDKNGNLRGIQTPDALHLATAIIHGCHEFHTFDDGGRNGFSLLSLNGNVAGHNITVCHPRVEQLPLITVESV